MGPTAQPGAPQSPHLHRQIDPIPRARALPPQIPTRRRVARTSGHAGRGACRVSPDPDGKASILAAPHEKRQLSIAVRQVGRKNSRSTPCTNGSRMRKCVLFNTLGESAWAMGDGRPPPRPGRDLVRGAGFDVGESEGCGLPCGRDCPVPGGRLRFLSTVVRDPAELRGAGD